MKLIALTALYYLAFFTTFSQYKFPLKASDDKKYLVDQNGTPFLLFQLYENNGIAYFNPPANINKEGSEDWVLVLKGGYETKKETSINVATEWMDALSDLLRTERIPPPGCLRLYAYTGLALYETQLPALTGYQSLFTHFSGNKIAGIKKQDYNSPIAANAAIAELVRKLGILKSQHSIDSLESTHHYFLQQKTSPAQSEASINYAKLIADAIFKWSRDDGTFAIHPPYSPNLGPGLWEPDPDTPNPPPGVYQGLLRTFVKNIVSLTAPATPPAYSTEPGSAFYKNAKTTIESRNSLSPADSILIFAWQNKPGTNYLTMVHMTKLLTAMLKKENYSLENASIVYAKNGIAMFDAVVTSFNAIYKHKVPRPVTYIHEVLDNKTWNTLYPYNFYPSYPSNFASCVSASATIMAKTFGESYAFTDNSQTAQFGDHHYTSITDFVNKVASCRMLAGTEFPFAMEAGKLQGRKTGELVENLPFKK